MSVTNNKRLENGGKATTTTHVEKREWLCSGLVGTLIDLIKFGKMLKAYLTKDGGYIPELLGR